MHARLVPRMSAAVFAALIGMTLCACALQPAYQPPATAAATATAWQAATPHGGRTPELVNWWTQFDDPSVAALIGHAEADNPTLAQATAQIRSARASLASSGASAWPAVTGSASSTRARQGATDMGGVASATAGLSTTHIGALDASWELDLLGRQRSARASAQALLQARIDDWHDARVSLAAEVADDYVQYRACQLLAHAYWTQADSQAQTARTTRAATAAGLTAPSDGNLAEAGAASSAFTAVAQATGCELLLKSLVALTGMQEIELRGVVDRSRGTPPTLPEPTGFRVDSVPAALLRQRPDLASAERALASRYADIGVALADGYPSLSLGGSIRASALQGAPSFTSWSLGPSLSLPILDGGANKAAIESARASYDQQLASYAGALRNAVKEVEQALVNLDGAARRTEDAKRAADQYQRYFSAISANWRAGNDSLLTMEEARRSATSAQVTWIELQRDRVRYWIALYKALGGGWQANADADAPATDVAVLHPGATK